MVSRKVLVMVPAYNEEKTVGEVVKTTIALYPGFKVVVVDDGSEDATAPTIMTNAKLSTFS